MSLTLENERRMLVRRLRTIRAELSRLGISKNTAKYWIENGVERVRRRGREEG